MKKISINKNILKSIFLLVILYLTIINSVVVYYIGLELEGFEKPAKEKLIVNYELKGDSPASYGFEYENVKFKNNSVTLTGWYIASKKPSNKVIYFVHGWKSSALSTLQFLDIEGLNENHNIFLINLRNSGDSSVTSSDLGYRTSSDVKAGIEFLQKEKGIKNFSFVSISMGAMATLQAIKDIDIEIDKILLDSPMSNAKRSIKSYDISFPALDYIVYIPAFFAINRRWDNSLDKLRFSYILNYVDTNKITIIQSDKDVLTKLNDLLNEISGFDISIHIFNKGSHAKIYRSNKEEYQKIFRKIILNENK